MKNLTDWTKAALVRAGRTVAQTAVALIGTATVIEAVDWEIVLSGSVLAGLLSLLTSVATDLPELDDDSDDEGQILPPPLA
jgi:hypothetical protein